MSVRPLHASELDRAVAVLEHAFFADPALVHLVPDPDRRRRVAPRIGRAFIRYGLRYGVVWCTDDVSGMALRRPPGRERIHLFGLLVSGMVWLPFALGLRATWRLLMAERETDARHRRLMRSRHWYLWMIGVHPDRQGEGLGARLMAHTFAQADADGVPCYLETTHPRAHAIHTAHGFRDAVRGVIPGTDLMVWSMVRAPGG